MEQLEIINLTKQFKDNVVLKDFNACFKKGTISAVIGESGCGKSTLLNIIGLLEKATSGKITFDGYGDAKPGNNKAMKLLRYEIAYLFQNYALMDNETVEQNLRLALEYTQYKKDNQVLKDVMKKVNLNESLLTKKVYTLSGGEQQRVAMARVMLKPCSVVLADEPTGNLDETNKMEIFKLLKDMAESGKIVIIVTHDKELAKLCDNCVQLEKVK